MSELPTLTASNYVSNAVDPLRGLLIGQTHMPPPDLLQQPLQHRKELPMPTAMRIVKVFIADPNENLALDKRVLHAGDEQLTDLTDQELFFEIPMASLLAQHNAARAKTIDKKQSEKFGRDVMLDAVRIRDLKMVVVTIAQF